VLSAPPIDVSALTGSPAACGVVVFCHRGAIWVTLIAKATFSLVPDGAMVPSAPADLVRADRPFDDGPRTSLRAASDFAPHRRRVDVTFVGDCHAHVGAEAVARLVRPRGTLLDAPRGESHADVGGRTPFPLPAPGAPRASAPAIAGAPWSALPAAPAPAPRDPLAETVSLVEVPASLYGARQNDAGRAGSADEVAAPPAPKWPPALPLRGAIYGRPKARRG
jgi:hypothetical protein